MMTYISQLDSRWRDDYLGRTNLRVGRWGCTVCCISMLTSYFGKFHAPNYLVKMLDFMEDREHYGLLVWNSVERETNFALKERVWGLDIKKFDEGCAKKDMATLLQVNGCHWVVAIKRIPLTNTYIIVDPLSGKKRLSNGYKITGGAVLIKKS